MTTTITIENLLAGCKSQNRKAQEQLYNRFAGKMLAICRRYANTTAEAEDIMQEGFVKIFTKITQYTGEGSFEGWLQRVMVNTAISAYRKNKAGMQTTEMQDNHADIVATHTSSHDTDDLLYTLNRLPAHYRVPFNLFAIEGYSHQEISEMTGISILQSRVNVCRARTMLKKALASIAPARCNEFCLSA
ncbi:hypothetical protein BC343_05070 [Mucilaginibacter pedocola]|uniref:RNA polymerase subunit sigma-70 n=2 Tax=Mucilaginibacter pedocola TaxID=1792845 RepID=A0A1S9PFZ6_9SPHI|nr:hypothetical protein BC343_05070 [Mucilaginibacter pedocola]